MASIDDPHATELADGEEILISRDEVVDATRRSAPEEVVVVRISIDPRPLPPTIEAATGGGGRHLYFAHPGGLVHNQVGLATGIDLRADGGFVVAPLSVHPSGRRYEWAHLPAETPLAPMPSWLLQLVRRRGDRPGHPIAHWRRLLRTGVEEGERNNSIASLAGHLLWHGVDPAVALELLLCWNATRCRPPLSPDEVARTVDSIVRLHVQGREDMQEPGEDAAAP